MKCKVDKDLLLLKFLYFFELSIVSSLFIYLTPFMYEWGINATEMAVINLVANIFAFFARPMMGYIADKYQIYKWLLIMLTSLCGIFYILHLACPKSLRPSIYSLSPQFNVSISTDPQLLTIYSPQLLTNTCWPSNMSRCSVSATDNSSFPLSLVEARASKGVYIYSANNYSLLILSPRLSCGRIHQDCNNSSVSPFTNSQTNDGLTWSRTFWLLGLAKIIGYICFSPIVSLTDAVTFVTLGHRNCNKFGFTRMFGTIGILVFSFVTAVVLEVVNVLKSNTGWIWISRMQQFTEFSPCFIVAFFLFLVVIVLAFFLKVSYSSYEKKDKKTPLTLSRFLELTSLNVIIRDWEVGIFFIFVVIGGFIYVVFLEYFFLIIFQRYSSLPKYFIGLISVVMTLSEAAAFGLSSHLLRIQSYEIWVSLSFLTWSLRWFSYIFTENFWFLLLTEVLNGPSFGLMLASMISHCSKFGTSVTQGKIQGLFSGIFFNIGGALGGCIGGVILEKLGMFGLFKTMGAISFVCGLYYPLQRFVIRRWCKAPRRPSEIHSVKKHDEDSVNGNLLLSSS